MKHLATLLFCTALPCLTHAQCEVNVPGNSTVIDEDTTIDDDDSGNYWVCPGMTATFNGFAPFVYAGEGCNITLNTTLAAIMAQANSTITVEGFNNNIYYDASTTVIDNGSNTHFNLCEEVVFTSTPAGSCDITSGIAAHGEEALISVFPNPAHDMLTLAVEGDELVGARLLDMSGRSVRSVPMPRNAVDLSGLEPGNYVVELHLASGITRRPIVVN